MPFSLQVHQFQDFWAGYTIFPQFSTVATLLTFCFQMEDLDKHLLIGKIEASCWKDQFKQVVSPLQLINILHLIQSILI